MKLFDDMLSIIDNYDFNYSFNCSHDIDYNLPTYKGFNVYKWKLMKKETIILCNTCELWKKKTLNGGQFLENQNTLT